MIAATGSSEAAVAAAGDRPVRRKLLFGIVSMALLMGSIDSTIVATALPTLARDLHTNITWASWTITVYVLARVVVLPFAGKLSDRYGRREVFLVTIAIFTVSSLLCGLVSNIYLLVVLRGLQAVGGGAFTPSATGLVADHFGRHRGRAVGMFVSVAPIGAIIGPIVGALFITYSSWRWIFLVNVPIGIALILLAARFIPRLRPPRTGQPLDLLGGLLLGAAILAAMLGMSLLGSGEVPLVSVGFIGPEVLGVALVGWFVYHSATAKHPFIPVRMLYGSTFGTLNLINLLYGGAVLGFASLVPLYAVERFGVTTLESGTLLNARAIGMIGTAALVSMLLARIGCRWPLGIGFVLTSIGMFAISFSPPGWASVYAWLVLSTCVSGIGMGTAGPASMNASLQLAVADVAAVASLRQMFRQLGSIMAISVSTAIAGTSADPGRVLGYVFAAFGVVMLGVLPLLRFVPDQRGHW
ncbi:MAG TPA: MFS transporter [Rugosimonospora sp.]|nr:MFS transporter [Rugosimonospora sp.]